MVCRRVGCLQSHLPALEGCDQCYQERSLALYSLCPLGKRQSDNVKACRLRAWVCAGFTAVLPKWPVCGTELGVRDCGGDTWALLPSSGCGWAQRLCVGLLAWLHI